jgi:hypothetical protein
MLAGLFVFIQMYFQVAIFSALYSDAPQKYTFSNHRAPNPYPLVASKIKTTYQPGDTIIYPSAQSPGFVKSDSSKRVYNTSDAQLVNLYLPEDAKYIQRIDLRNQDSILIRGAHGRRIVLFDFAKNPHRY